MGRSITTQTDIFNDTESRLNEFRDLLVVQDKEAFDNLMAHARKHITNASELLQYYPLEALLFSITLEQEKGAYRLKDIIGELLNVIEKYDDRIEVLENKVLAYEEQLKKILSRND